MRRPSYESFTSLSVQADVLIDIGSISNDMAAETFYYPPWRDAFSRLVEMGLGMSGLRELEISG